MEDEAVDQAIPQTMPRGRHIKKRALRNKALSIEFNEKDLRDFVTGFHKRKKKRRKEAQKQQEDALRRKRIENRKKRKLERELGLYDGAPPPTWSEPDDDEYLEVEEDTENALEEVGDDGTKTYENEDFKITVTTSEIAPEDAPQSRNMQEVRQHYGTVDKKQNLPVTKKTLRKSSKHKSRPKQQKKRDKRKTGKKNKKTC